jgi:hypothetical protein
MARVEAALVAEFQARPGERFRLIARVTGELAQAEARLVAGGARVRRRSRLINGLVIECTGAQIAALLAEPWLVSVELDQPVQVWTSGR